MHNLLLTALLATANHALPSTTTKRQTSSPFNFIGINESGPEFGEANLPGVYGTDYTWPNLSSIDTFLARGDINTFRINTLLERMAPQALAGALDEAYMANLTQTVQHITSQGAYAMIVPHNYGRYYGDIITSASDFGAFWTKVAGMYKGETKVIFDTNNEFHDMEGELVAELNQAAVDAIRGAGATEQWITVEGNAWTGAWTWVEAEGTDGRTNAETMGGLEDVEGKLIYQMHQYLDSDGSGTSETCVNSTIGSERLVAATEWLRSNEKVGLLGEYAGAVNDVCEDAVKDMLSYLRENSDVWKGHIWWAAGPWWADYMFSVEPADGPAFETYVPIMAGET